ncbi:hypothetical protein U1Q18_038632 [Sarracenia purpurea var. burkii]
MLAEYQDYRFLGRSEDVEKLERHRALKQHQVQTMKKQRLMLKRPNKAMWWRNLWNRYRKRDDVQTGEIPTPLGLKWKTTNLKMKRMMMEKPSYQIRTGPNQKFRKQAKMGKKMKNLILIQP